MRIIREIREDDADNFLSLCRQLDEESRFMLLEPGERTIPVEEQAQRIRNILSAHNQAIFVAEEEGTLVGHLSAYGGRFARNRHVAYIMVGILKVLQAGELEPPCSRGWNAGPGNTGSTGWS